MKRATALSFVAKTHRRLPNVQGAMWAIAAWRGPEIVGVALVGWPSQVWTSNEIDTLARARQGWRVRLVHVEPLRV